MRRSPSTVLIACGAALAAGCAHPVAQARCGSPGPYRGAGMHAAPAEPVFGPAGAIGGPLDGATVRRLDSALSVAAEATRAPSITAAVAVPGRGAWSAERPGAVGEQAAPLHYWASVGKTFTAVVVLQMVQEGKLSLDDPIERWVAGVPNGDRITLEMLLNHTSGLYSANEAPEARASPSPLRFEAQMRILREHGPLFCPGENWRYSNTGYALLGRVIEQVDGRPYHQAVTARIVDRLGLRRLRVLAPGEVAGDVAPLVPSDPAERPMNPGDPGPAGSVVGPAEEMIRVWQALLTGRLLSPETTRRMFRDLYPMFGEPMYYGLGVMLFTIPAEGGPPAEWLGHAGGAPGVKALVAWSPADGAFAAVALTGDGSAVATVNLLLRQLRSAPTP